MCDPNQCGWGSCACEDFEPSPYVDNLSNDWATAHAVVQPHPELESHWHSMVLWFDELVADYGPGEDMYPEHKRRYFSPIYLNEVVRQHIRLQSNVLDVDAAIAAKCEAIVAVHHELADFRRKQLADPWWRAHSLQSAFVALKVSDYYDPDFLQRQVDLTTQRQTPYSPEWLDQRWLDEQRGPRNPLN